MARLYKISDFSDPTDLKEEVRNILNINGTKLTEQQAEAIINLILDKVEKGLPKEYPEVGVTQNQISYARGYNQALGEQRKLIKELRGDV